jgi:16S rRNA (guanine527-N7)-methyltransferase
VDARFGGTLEPALAALPVELSPGARAAIEVHARLLLAWAPSINLTAIRTPEAIALEHVADSLAGVRLARSLLGPNAAGAPLLDLGSGAGYPGLPLAVALPARRAALVESVGKKVSFLEVAAGAAREAMTSACERPPDVLVLGDRAETLAADPTHRDGWQLVVARAVAPLPELAELALPLVSVGGWLLAWKRDDGSGGLERELAAAGDHIGALGGASGPPLVEPVRLPALADHRLVAVRKERPTPSRYPRPTPERRRDWPRRRAARGRVALLP